MHQPIEPWTLRKRRNHAVHEHMSALCHERGSGCLQSLAISLFAPPQDARDQPVLRMVRRSIVNNSAARWFAAVPQFQFESPRAAVVPGQKFQILGRGGFAQITAPRSDRYRNDAPG